jgi:2-polyprenyl-6-methoxyphenol hydroxylase-like FAD-dependent oxidoreductase
VLVERRGFDEMRPGEHLSGHVRGALDALQIPARDFAGIVTSSPGIVSLWTGGPPLTKPYAATGGAPALRVVRHRFDALLFDAAAAAGAVTFLPGTVLRARRQRGKGWRAELNVDGDRIVISARIIVDASGRAAVFARKHRAKRINHGDLFAIVAWLRKAEPDRPNAGMLTVESTPLGWWSACGTCDDMLVVSLFTSAAMMKSQQASAHDWWDVALAGAPYVGHIMKKSGAIISHRRIFPSFPSRSSRMHGAGWIAVGEAAAAFDPLCGQGVAYAMESAFRAFEAVSLETDWSSLGVMYQDAMNARFEDHLALRVEVYEEATDVLRSAFFRNAVIPGPEQVRL